MSDEYEKNYMTDASDTRWVKLAYANLRMAQSDQRITDLERRNVELEEALLEFTSGSTETQYFENMKNAACHAGLVSIEQCGRCSRQLKAIRALTRTKEQR